MFKKYITESLQSAYYFFFKPLALLLWATVVFFSIMPIAIIFGGNLQIVHAAEKHFEDLIRIIDEDQKKIDKRG